MCSPGGSVVRVELDHLAPLRQGLDAFPDGVGGGLGAPVEHGGRTLRDLHVGEGNRWAAPAGTERDGHTAAAAPVFRGPRVP
jgi:hypothetical protein